MFGLAPAELGMLLAGAVVAGFVQGPWGFATLRGMDKAAQRSVVQNFNLARGTIKFRKVQVKAI